MISKISICYLLKFNRGSEWMLGENVFKTLDQNEIIFTPLHQIKEGQEPHGQIGSIAYFRKEGIISVIGIPSLFKTEPKSPMIFRIDYFFWITRVYRIIIKKGLERIFITHNNFAQILTPVPKKIRNSEKFVFGPIGGQGPYYRCKFLSFKYRLWNFFIFEVLYSILSRRIHKMNTICIHPILGKKFDITRILPAIALDQFEVGSKSIKKSQVIHVARHTYFKLPHLHREIFYRLAILNPDIDFKIIGSDWKYEQVLENFEIVGPIHRDLVMNVFDESSYHINLSLELAGFVNLEAASAKCITIGAKESGSHFLLDLDCDHYIDLYDKNITIEKIVEKLSKRICIYDNSVAQRQFSAASRFSIKSLKNPSHFSDNAVI